MPTLQQARKTSSRGATPKYSLLASRVRKQIERGRLKAGDRLPSFAEMQTEFGATTTTVQRVYATLEQEGLIVRHHGRGTFVADKARRVKTHAIGCAGFDFKETSSPYWSHLMQGIQDAAHKEEMEVVLLRPDATRGLERVDGVLVHGGDARALPAAASLLPTVALMDTLPGVPSVMADDWGGARMATRHLLELGHRKIACLSYFLAPINQRRLAGYRAALRDAKITPRASWARDIEHFIPTTSLRESGYLNMKKWLSSDWRKLGCTALLCQNDQFAVGVLRALGESGLRVPQDVSVIGFDGLEEGEYSTPRLTSVAVPLEDISARATALLLRRIRHQSLDSGFDSTSDSASLTLPVQLEVRDSTARPKL